MIYKEAWYKEAEEQIPDSSVEEKTPQRKGLLNTPSDMHAVEKFLARPMTELYDRGFFDVKPDEVRIRLRINEAGKVEMVVFALNQGVVNEFVVPFDAGEIGAELCG